MRHRTAGQWIQHCEDYDALQPSGPTPVQSVRVTIPFETKSLTASYRYGILVSLLGAPTYTALARAGNYAFRKGRSSLPRLFLEPLIFAIILFLLSHAIGVGDLECADWAVWTAWNAHREGVAQEGAG